MLDRTNTIAAVVLDHSECAEIFQRHRIDFCCRGDQSIETAATNRGLDTDELLQELMRAIADRSGEPGQDLRELSTDNLINYIIATHHEYLREALPFINALASKVSRVHGDHNPKLRDLATAIAELEAALIPHLDDEEKTLFPALSAAVAAAKTTKPTKLAQHFASMQQEHLQVASLLERIRAASEDFTLPDWACTSYRTLFAELAALETDVHSHVHLENHVLRPRFSA